MWVRVLGCMAGGAPLLLVWSPPPLNIGFFLPSGPPSIYRISKERREKG
jgi:hypothetical protein